jgi:hypothetical protein
MMSVAWILRYIAFQMGKKKEKKNKEQRKQN